MTNNSIAKKSEIEGWAGLFGALGFFAGLGIFAYQIYLWLKLGQWTPMPLGTLLKWVDFDFSSLNNIDWLGIRKIIAWILDLPLSISLIFISIVIGGVAGYLVGSVRELGRKSVS